VYGHPIKHSASPAMQNAGIAALGLDWRYVAFDVQPEELPAALAGARAMRFLGLNLTVPHKLLAVDLMDELDDSARLWGAVNTVRFEAREPSGEWRPLAVVEGASVEEIRAVGFNTDADAITRSLREDLGFEPRGACVLVLGAGGAGRTAALKLASEGAARLHLVNRTGSKAKNVAEEIRRRFPSTEVELGYPAGDVELLVNATSLGLRPDDGLPYEVAEFALQRARAVYDMIYRPAETALLTRAKAAGCRTANGLGMLLYQGASALELWAGRPAPIGVMRKALMQNIYGGTPHV
jgi:shikimate dehydrogenase